MEVVKFPELTHLTLMAEGTRATGVPVLPVIDQDSGRNLFELLRRNKVGSLPLQYLKIQRGGMKKYAGRCLAPGVKAEQNYCTTFEYHSDASGNISVTKRQAPTLQETAERLAAERTAFNAVRYADPPANISVEGLLFLASRLDPEWAERELESAGLIRDAVGPQEGEDKSRQVIVQMADRIVKLDAGSRDIYMKRLKKLLIEKKKVEAMEKVFTRECTLYDIYCN
jgi:hypothetical protein